MAKRASKRRDFTKEVERELEELSHDPGFLLESLKLDVQEKLVGLMKLHGLSRSALAKKLGCTQPHVTHLLDGTRNFTLRTLVTAARAFGLKVSVEFVRPEGP